jgi:hypothetical protein
MKTSSVASETKLTLNGRPSVILTQKNSGFMANPWGSDDLEVRQLIFWVQDNPDSVWTFPIPFHSLTFKNVKTL